MALKYIITPYLETKDIIRPNLVTFDPNWRDDDTGGGPPPVEDALLLNNGNGIELNAGGVILLNT